MCHPFNRAGFACGTLRYRATSTGAKLLPLRLFQCVGIESNPSALIEDFINFACAASTFEVMNDSVHIIAQKPLPASGLCWSCHVALLHW